MKRKKKLELKPLKVLLKEKPLNIVKFTKEIGMGRKTFYNVINCIAFPSIKTIIKVKELYPNWDLNDHFDKHVKIKNKENNEMMELLGLEIE